MKVNWDFYEQSEKEEQIEEKWIKAVKKNKEEILEEDDITIIEDFSSIKDNILNWYHFKKDAHILEINTDLGKITRLLSKNAKEVIATCENKEIANLLNDKYQNIRNISLYIGKIDNIKIESKFDYIICYNLRNLEIAKSYLKEDGVILLIVDNQFSIASFAGAKPKKSDIFETIMQSQENTFSKRKIENKLEQLELENYKFYYPLPNYRMPDVIFSDEYMPNEKTIKLMYHISYRKGSAVVFDELKALKELTRDGQFANFANSYLVEINNQDNQPDFISFNNMRKTKYRLMTKIYKDNVEKTHCFEEAKQHIENIGHNSENLKKLGFNIIDKKQGENIFSPYMKSNTLDKILANYISEGKIGEAYKLIEKWYKHISDKLSTNEKAKINNYIKDIKIEELEGLTIIKNGYIDLVFENIFFENNEFILFDQEWYFEGIPMEYILFRAINNLYIYHQEISSVLSYEEMMKKFGLIQYVNIFNKIEEHIQNEIIDKKMKKVSQKSLNELVDAKMLAIMKIQVEDYKKDHIKKEEYIKSLEKEVKKSHEIIKQYEQKSIKSKIKRVLKGRK